MNKLEAQARELLAAEISNPAWAQSIRIGDGRVGTGVEEFALRAIQKALASRDNSLEEAAMAAGRTCADPKENRSQDWNDGFVRARDEILLAIRSLKSTPEPVATTTDQVSP
jgi:hypothetical protein